MSTEETTAVVNHHLQAFGAAATHTGEVSEILKDYTEDALLFHTHGKAKGHGELTAFFEDFIANAPAGLVEAISIDKLEVDGDVAYLLWSASSFVAMATDTFVLRDGKIAIQTFAAHMAS